MTTPTQKEAEPKVLTDPHEWRDDDMQWKCYATGELACRGPHDGYFHMDYSHGPAAREIARLAALTQQQAARIAELERALVTAGTHRAGDGSCGCKQCIHMDKELAAALAGGGTEGGQG